MSAAGAELGLMDDDALGKHHATAGEASPCEVSLHDKFVEYVRALTGSTERQSAVWMEHSYARARRGGGGGGAAAAQRALLVRRPPPCPDCHADDDQLYVDVDSIDPAPRPPLSPDPVPSYERALSEEDTISMVAESEGGAEEWEEKLESLAPTPTHRRLAANVLELTRSLRAARLAGAGRSARSHARRLRRELAPLWSYPGALQQRPAAWMHAALSAYLPRPYLHVYNDMVSELVRAVPRLGERLLAGQVAPAPPEPEPAGTRVTPANHRPLLVWLPSGRERRDALWERNLAHLLPVHRIESPSVGACSPEAWCAALAAATRSALAALATVPRSALVLCGWGAGAALALHAASTWEPAAGAPPAALVLLSPPLLTAEGPRDSLDDPLLDLKMPVLFVVGQNAMQCTVGMAEEVRARLAARSRLVVVGAADDALRLTQHKLRSERVTQPMIYAALAEEVREFVTRALRDELEECSEEPEEEPEPEREREPEPAPPPPAPRRRVPPHHAHVATTPPPAKRQRYGGESATMPPAPAYVPVSVPAPMLVPVSVPAHVSVPDAPPSPVSPAAPSAGKGRGLALLRVSSAPLDPNSSLSGRTTTDWEEVLADAYHHKPDARSRNIRITETVLTRGTVMNGNNMKGFSVVSRGTGSVPLSLPPPRRATPAPPAHSPASLATADIMQLPIVFADDDKHSDEVLYGGEEAMLPSLGPSPSPSPTRLRAAPAVVTTHQMQSFAAGTSLKYTKVILAKRPTVTVGPGGARGGGGGGGVRPIIVKGGVKILPKELVIKRRPVTVAVPPPHDNSRHGDKSPM